MGTNRLIYIRTDANSHIATGHLVRCLSVAKACLSHGMQVCFVVSDRESKSLLDGFLSDSSFSGISKYDLRCLSTHVLQTAVYDNPEQELPEILDLISGADAAKDCDSDYSASVFFLDSYYVTRAYLSTLKPVIKIAYIDDLQLFDYPVDLLINYDVIPEDTLTDYQKAYQNAGKLLLGGSYAPLRPQFQNRAIAIKETVSNVLVATGGSDPYHFCLRFSDAAKSLPFTFHIVVGKLNCDKDELSILTDGTPNIILHENVSDMAALMEVCDLAVSAAGTTLYELCALGLPAISYTMADNQLTAADAFDRVNAIPCAGDIRSSYESVLANIINFVTDLSENIAKRKSAHETMRRLIDGSGSDKIADALSSL